MHGCVGCVGKCYLVTMVFPLRSVVGSYDSSVQIGLMGLVASCHQWYMDNCS